MDLPRSIIKNLNLAAKRTDLPAQNTKPNTSPVLKYEPGEEQDQEFMIAIIGIVGRLFGVDCISRIIRNPEGRQILRKIRRAMSKLNDNGGAGGAAKQLMDLAFGYVIQEGQNELQRLPEECWNNDMLEAAIRAMNAYDKKMNPGQFDQYMKALFQVMSENVGLASLDRAALNAAWFQRLTELYPDNAAYAGGYAYAICITNAQNEEILAYITGMFALGSLITSLGTIMMAFNGGVAVAAVALAAIIRAATSVADLISRLITGGFPIPGLS
jgi:hypothetical protein